MIGETPQIDSPNITFSNGEHFGFFHSLHHAITQLRVKLISEFGISYALVVFHNGFNVGANPRMEDKPHQLRRRLICWSNCSKEIPKFGSASRSAARRRASAIPSSSS